LVFSLRKSLHLDYGRASLHINAPAVPHRRFEIYIVKIAWFEFKWRGEDELTDIGLNFCLRPLGVADYKSLKSIKQAASLAGQQTVNSSGFDRDRPTLREVGVREGVK
jgi:hypothetical protein